MSEFHAQMDDYQQVQQPQGTSGLAMASLACSLFVCCPLVTILGPILGVAAVATIGSPPRKKGKGLAIAGIILGLLTTIGSGAAYWVGYRWTMDNVAFVLEGPDPALRAGFAGDADGFRSHFHGPGARASDEEIRAFLDELEERYGTYVRSEFDVESGASPSPTSQQGQIVFPYRLEFVDEAVSAEVELIWDESMGRSITALGHIHVYDPDLGDLRFPAAASP